MRGRRLTERDTAVVVDVYKYRYLKASQIADLHFPSQQTANRRLRSLVDQGYISYFTVPNIEERIYRITTAGAKLVAQVLGVAPGDLLWSKGTSPPKDYYFVQHFAAVSDFRIMLTKACEGSEVDLLGFIPEYYGKRHASGRVTKYIKDVVFDVRNPREKISHTPDAVFALSKGGKPALFFLEIDRGTESLSNPERGVYKMIRFYEGLAKSGRFKGYGEDFGGAEFKVFRLLIVTTSPVRVRNMRETLGALEQGSVFFRFIWLTDSIKLNSDTFWGSMWASLDVCDESNYSLA